MTPMRQRVLDELQRRNYAKDTARAYVLAIKQFAEYFGKRRSDWAARRFAASSFTYSKTGNSPQAPSKGACPHYASSTRRS